jgi:hypothetical protein
MLLPRHVLAAGTAILMLSAAPAFAAQEHFTAQMSPAAETPPATDSSGSGTVDATLDTDTKMLTWTINYTGLTGDATAAHFHGPAKEGEKAGPVVPINGVLTSPISGSATLTDAQIAELENGLWYFNVHTAAHPDGEIRGQVTKAAAM